MPRPVFDPNAPSSKAALEAYATEAPRLLRYALWRTQDFDAARDLVADALYRTCDPEGRPWDPARSTFFQHMRRRMDDLAIQRARRGAGRFERRDDDENPAADRLVDSHRVPDQELHARRHHGWLQGLMARLRERLRGRDPLVERIWQVACEEGLSEPAELAEALGEPVVAIYEAMRRMRYHAAKLRDESDARDEAERAERRARNTSGARDTSGTSGARDTGDTRDTSERARPPRAKDQEPS